MAALQTVQAVDTNIDLFALWWNNMLSLRMSLYLLPLVSTMVILSVGAKGLTRYELSLLQKCSTVDDCVAVNYGACDCANGGGLYGINKNSVSDFEATFPSGDYGCSEIGNEVPCDEGTFSCSSTEDRGLCLWTSDYLVDASPACQPSNERPTASPDPDALSDTELDPLRECFDDLQCIVVTNKFSTDRNMIGEEIAINSASIEAFQAAFNQTTDPFGFGTTYAMNTPYVWRIGTTKCQSGECIHVPAPSCDEIKASDNVVKGPSSQPSSQLSNQPIKNPSSGFNFKNGVLMGAYIVISATILLLAA